MFSPVRRRVISLPRTGAEGDHAELLDAVELVLGDLDAVELEDPGVLVVEVDLDVVDQPRELAALRVDRLDGGRKARGRLPPVVVSVLCTRVTPNVRVRRSTTITTATRPGCSNARVRFALTIRRG